MQQRPVVCCVASDKHVSGADLQRLRVVYRNAHGIERQVRVLEIEARDVWAAPGRCDDVVDFGKCMVAVEVRVADLHAVFGSHHLVNPGVGIEVELGRERVAGRVPHGRVGQWANDFIDAEHHHLHAETMQRLAEFETDHPRPEDGNAFGKVMPVENIVVD